jgi:hypothetical protein
MPHFIQKLHIYSRVEILGVSLQLADEKKKRQK